MNFFSFLFRKGPPAKTVLPRSRHKITHKDIDPAVLSILYRLKDGGYQAYLVGGCVRDLLLSRKPKDFDVVTNAKPRQIKDLFRRCRLIGRRFRLAHVYVTNDRVIEVATFRALVDPAEETDSDDRFAANNVFGTIEEDAVRRDFTVNSLYFDFRDSSIVDFAGGLQDIKKRILRSINDPEKSLPEDPVRIVRAARFAAMLDLKFSPADHKAAVRHSGLLAKANPSRMLEELRKIIRCGFSAGVFGQLQKLGVLRHWIPELSDPKVFGPTIKRLEILDRRVREGRIPSEPLMLTCLFYDLFLTGLPAGETRYQESFVLLRQNFRQVTLRLQLPKWEWYTICEIAARQAAMKRPPDLKRPSRFYKWFVSGPLFKDSFDFFAMDLELTGGDQKLLAQWTEAEKHLRAPHHPHPQHRGPGTAGQHHAHPQRQQHGHQNQQQHRTPHAHPQGQPHPPQPHPGPQAPVAHEEMPPQSRPEAGAPEDESKKA
jgi:poly(A) polymerase